MVYQYSDGFFQGMIDGVGGYNCKEHNELYLQYRKGDIVLWAHKVMGTDVWCVKQGKNAI
jgi:hypothetical protein